MTITDHYSRAWVELQKNPMAWVVFYAVFSGVAVMTCGLGFLLMPNVLREVRDSLAGDRAPELGAMFRTDRLGNDVFNMGILWVAISAGSLIAGIGGTVAAFALQMLSPLAADDRYAPLDNAKISLQHVLAHAGDHFVFFLIAGALVSASSMLCLLPLLVAMPLIGVAHWLWYQQVRGELDDIAAKEGIRLIERAS